MHDQLINAIFYLLAAVIAVPIFERLRLGAILGYLAAGVIIGPFGIGLISNPADTLHLAELGVVLLLFVIGLELSPTTLWRMRNWILLLGNAQLFGTAGIILLVMVLVTGAAAEIALMVGLALGLSSTAFAIALLTNYRILNTRLGQKGFSILLLQDLAVIPILLYVEALAGAGDEGGSGPGWWLGVAAVAGILIAGRYLVNPVLRIVANYGSKEVMTAASLLIVLGTALVIEAAGMSMGMGAFIAGILLANSSFRHQLEADVEPFKGLLLGLFFIAIGMTLDIDYLLQEPAFILALAVGLVVLKTGVVTLLARLSGSPLHDAVRLGLILSQGGEFAFVVMTQAVGANVVDAATANTISLVVGLSMALTAPLIGAYNKLIVARPGAPEDYDGDWDESEPEVLIAGFGRVGQITGRILSANGIRFTALDKNAEHIEFVKRFGHKVFFGDATRLDLLETAGIRHARVLLVAVDDEDAALAIVKLVRAECPSIRIISRAHNRTHLLQQRQAGADRSVREMFNSSLLLAEEVLQAIDINDERARELTRVFTTHDEALIEQSLGHADELEKLIEIGAQGRRELEQLFAKDSGGDLGASQRGRRQ
ncbi:MAG: monovalent cation:proton antiporter-2 (CPA2) family protein [Pseudomonadota bacterium]